MDIDHNERRAKSILRKYHITAALISLLYLAAVFALLFLADDWAVQVWGIVLCTVLFYLISRIMSARTIMLPLILRLDAPLYYALVKRGRMAGVSAIHQIQAEYFVGHYANVISLCNQKLEARRADKQWKYYYFSYLANSYFNLGDDERLREICNRFYQSLASERKKDKIFKRFEGFSFFSVYLNRNFEACEQYLSKVQKNPLLHINTVFLKARTALLKEDAAQAKTCFETVVAEAPLLHYARLSEAALQAMENGEEYREAVSVFSEAEVPAPLQPPAVASFLHVYSKVIRILFIALVLFCTVILLIGKVIDSGSQSWDEYCAEIETLVEADYGDVTVLDAFDLKKEDFWVDAMFICKTSDSILVGSLYYYEDDWDTTYYEIQAQISLSTLLSDDFRQMSHTYDSVTEECSVTSAFYANEGDVPEKNYYSTVFDVEGRRFAFAVTAIVDGVYSV